MASTKQTAPNRRRKTGSGAAGGPRKASPEDQFMAAAIGDAEWLRQSLREPGATAGAFDRNGLAAVHLAAIHGRLDCLRLLIEQFGCDVNSASSTGWRPVHLCISAQTGPRSLQCLLYLLDKGADHSCVNDDMVTPVHQAASEGHLQALQLLIKLGAKLDQVDNRGFRPIDMAKIWGHRKCARLLATETWHREKDQVARKLKMEKRLAMKDLLKQFEKEEQVAHDMRYQGNEAFNEWVQQIEEAKSSHKKHHRASDGQQQQQQQQQQEQTTAEPPRASLAERYRQPTVTEDQADVDGLQAQVREAIDEANEILGERGVSGQATGREERPALKLVHHPQDWNYSTKVSICFNPYQKRLDDVYPRDTFTKMPHPVNSYPLRLNVRSRHPEAALAGDSDRREMLEVGAQRQDTDEDADADQYTQAPPPRASATIKDERPFREQLFACKSVLDIQRRKRLDEVIRRYRGEAAAHLSSDSRSFLFRDALGLEPVSAAADSPAPGSAPSKKSSRRSSGKSVRSSTSQRMEKAPMASRSSGLLTPEIKV